ncbi:MAG: hypothetical protein IPJ94_16730 [Chloroflexi bacterium]|nr:hypothetical protein [Chloroflexota bacterium]
MLLLDNFEHLLPQAGPGRCPAGYACLQRLLVTSRERLNLYEEWLVELGGLALPPAAAVDWTGFSAPQLFIQRARRVYLGFDSAAERRRPSCVLSTGRRFTAGAGTGCRPGCHRSLPGNRRRHRAPS